MSDFSFRFWGVRGALASCSVETQGYGANTACVEVNCGDALLILDAGSGLRLLGNAMMARRAERTHLMFTHCHYDHISGLPFFAPFFDPSRRIDVWSGHLDGPVEAPFPPDAHVSSEAAKASEGQGTRTAAMMSAYMSPPFFPVGPEVFTATIRTHDFKPGDRFEPEPGVAVRTCLLNHHDRAVAYRIDYAGRSLAYVTDTTHIPGKPDLTILALVEGVDAMIYDATYTDDEFPQFWNFGHSTWEEGARIADAAGVGTYLPFHHRPSRSDGDLDRLEVKARKMFADTVFAREGARHNVGSH